MYYELFNSLEKMNTLKSRGKVFFYCFLYLIKCVSLGLIWEYGVCNIKISEWNNKPPTHVPVWCVGVSTASCLIYSEFPIFCSCGNQELKLNFNSSLLGKKHNIQCTVNIRLKSPHKGNSHFCKGFLKEHSVKYTYFLSSPESNEKMDLCVHYRH